MLWLFMIIFTIENSNYTQFINSIISTSSTNSFPEVLVTTKELYSFYSDKNYMLLCNIVSEILFKLYKSLDIPFNDLLAMVFNCDSVLKKESVKSVCVFTNNENQSKTDLDYTRLNFYEEKYTSALLISNAILSHPELKKTSLNVLNFLNTFSLLLDTSQEKIQAKNLI